MLIKAITAGGMRRWGLRGCEPIPRYKSCLRVIHFTTKPPMAYDRLLGNVYPLNSFIRFMFFPCLISKA